MRKDKVLVDSKMICVFCNAEWNPIMETEYYNISDGCPTCGDGAKAEITVTITCGNCGRIVYSKETTKTG